MSCELKEAKIKEEGEQELQLSLCGVQQWLLNPSPHVDMSPIFFQPLPSFALVHLLQEETEEGCVILIAPGPLTVFSARQNQPGLS